MSSEDTNTMTLAESNNATLDEAMGKSLLEQLPGIVAASKRKAEAILERAQNESKIDLQGRELVNPIGSFEDLPQFLRPGDVNSLIYGDNLLAMAALLAGTDDRPSLRGKIDLIYIDPPFDSKADYRHKIKLGNGNHINQKATVIEQFAYSDTWSDGSASYMKMLIPRLVLMRELLSENGSIYVHLDWHVSHYVKIVMDEIFGKENFRNEIVWKRCDAHNDPNKFGVIHDNILFYAKSKSGFIWNDNVDNDPLPQKTIDNWYSCQEVVKSDIINRIGVEFARGDIRFFNKADITGAGSNGNDKPFRGMMPPPGRHWAYKSEQLEKLDKEGRIYFSKSGKPYEKRYLDESKGIAPQSIWSDISFLRGISKNKDDCEGLDFQTQKPEKLLERIIKISSNKDSLVADFFCGSGTTPTVAEKLGRRWIACDLGKPACMVTRKRLLDLKSKPFLFMNIGDYQIEQMRSHFGKKYRIGELSEIILGLFGATPLPSDVNPNRNLGKISGKTLIFCDSPNKITGLKTLKKAMELRENLMGGWNKVVVLGWNFDSQISQHIQTLNDSALEVLVIPPDLLDRLKKKGSKLKPTEVRFSTLQYLQIVPQRQIMKDSEQLKINLQNYVLLSPEALHLEDAERRKIQQIANNDPIALIEYWGIDPNYDGITFRPVWHSYRGEDRITDEGRYSIDTHAILDLPKQSGSRKICVRAVDIFGFEAQTVQEVH